MRLLLTIGISFFVLMGCQNSSSSDGEEVAKCYSEQKPYVLVYLLPGDCKSCMPGFLTTVENTANKHDVVEGQIVLLGGKESRRVELEYLHEQHLKAAFGDTCACILQSEAIIKEIQKGFGLHAGSFYAVNDGRGNWLEVFNFKESKN